MSLRGWGSARVFEKEKRVETKELPSLRDANAKGSGNAQVVGTPRENEGGGLRYSDPDPEMQPGALTLERRVGSDPDFTAVLLGKGSRVNPLSLPPREQLRNVFRFECFSGICRL